MIIDESYSFGTVGRRGAGLTDHFNVPIEDVDILVGSMTNGFCGAGGFCTGSHAVVDHQRLGGLSYIFSASMPAMLAVAASEAISYLQSNPLVLDELHENSRAIYSALETVPNIRLSGDKSVGTPLIHLRLSNAIAEKITSGLNDRDACFAQEKLLQDIVDEVKTRHVCLVWKFSVC